MRTLGLVLLVVLGLPVPARAAGMDPSTSGYYNPEAYGSHLLTMQRSYRLLDGFGAAARPLPVAPAVQTQGTDLGTGARGQVVAAYTRCPKDVHTTCVIYEYDFASHREYRLSSPACNATQPVIDHGVLVWKRGRSRHRGTDCHPGVYAKRPGRPKHRLAVPRGCVPEDFRNLALVCTVEQTHYRPNGSSFDLSSRILVRRAFHTHWETVVHATAFYDRGGLHGTLHDAPVLAPGGFVVWRRTVDDTAFDILKRSAKGGRVLTLDRAGRDYGYALGPIAVAGTTLYYGFTDTEFGQLAKVTRPTFH